MSVQDYAVGIGFGALTGGVANGSIAAIKGNNFWTGNQVAAGRGVFSVTNTPIKTAPEMNPIPGKPISGVNAPAAKSPLSNQELINKDFSANNYRYISKEELNAIQETGLLRGGREGENYFTKDIYKSALKVQQRLALPNKPTIRIEFEVINDPTIMRNGTKVIPAYEMPGKGSEFMTTDQVKIKLLNWQKLGR